MLNEFNSKDKSLVREMNDYFTISIEYELVYDVDVLDEPYLETDEEIERALGYVKNQTLLDLSRGMVGRRDKEKYKLPEAKLKDNERKMFDENDTSDYRKKELKKLHHTYYTWTWVNYFIDYLLSKVDVDDEEKTKKRIDGIYENKLDDYIVTLIVKNLDGYVFNQNMDWLINNFKISFPKFYEKWAADMKFEFEADEGETRILEFSPKTYLSGLNECFKQLDDFYQEFNNQHVWKMDNDRTGLHINIGVSSKNIKWNPIKGMLMMSDMNRGEKVPYVFKDITHRLNKMYTRSLLDAINRNLSGDIEDETNTDDEGTLINLKFRHKKKLAKHKDYIKRNINSLDLHNIQQTEDFLNGFLIQANKDFYIKEFGIKLIELEYEPGYVEFRYVGGEVSKDLLEDKILYFCYIVYLMTNVEYKKQDYHKRLYKYVQQLRGLVVQ
jgi:hypothetical protein